MTTQSEDHEYVSETGVVITEMPTLEPEREEASCDETRIRRSPSDTERMSKMDEEAAEQVYKERRNRVISQMLNQSSKQTVESSGEGKSQEDSLRKVKISLNDDSLKNGKQRPNLPGLLNAALEKSNNSLRYSAEMRIAQIYKNANQILQSLDKLKNPKVNSQIACNKPIIAKPENVKPENVKPPSEEEAILKEIEKLDTLLKEKVNSTKDSPHRSIVIKKGSKNETKIISKTNMSIDCKTEGEKVEKENIDVPGTTKSLVNNLSMGDLRQIAKNRAMNYQAMPQTTKSDNRHLYSHGKIYAANQ